MTIDRGPQADQPDPRSVLTSRTVRWLTAPTTEQGYEYWGVVSSGLMTVFGLVSTEAATVRRDPGLNRRRYRQKRSRSTTSAAHRSEAQRTRSTAQTRSLERPPAARSGSCTACLSVGRSVCLSVSHISLSTISQKRHPAIFS